MLGDILSDIPPISVCGVVLFEGGAPKPAIAGPTRLWAPFKLPIDYAADLHPLAASVVEDLELTAGRPNTILDDLAGSASPSPTMMYEHLLSPSNPFGRMMMKEWRSTTTDIGFLEDTQSVLGQTEKYKEVMSGSSYVLDFEKITGIWTDTSPSPLPLTAPLPGRAAANGSIPSRGGENEFCNRYPYIGWRALKECNQSELFLQLSASLTLLSPLMSFIIPVVFMALPFALLKLQGIPISFEEYSNILMDMAKKHFVGQALFSCRESMSITNIIYFFAMMALYAFQIYNNVSTCVGYHRNIRKINTCLIDAREYATFSVRSMTAFADLHGDKPGYRTFCREVKRRCDPLREYADRLKNITPFSNTPDKLADMGRLLALFYELHNDAGLRESIQYSFGFAGYIDNMLGVYNSLAARAVNFATFTRDGGDLTMRAQYYAAHRDEAFVSNDCSLTDPMIISGPNASGKTTFLKATAINVVMTQQFGCGFYEECEISPYAHISTYLNIPDSSGRDSLFQAEARRCKDIVESIRADPDHRHFCIFDELFSGTNPEEAASAGCALVSYLAGFRNVNFLLTTHYRAICDRFRKAEPNESAVAGIRRRKRTAENWRMSAESDGEKMRYSYKIERGISVTKGAADVLRAMDFPKEILNDVDAFPQENADGDAQVGCATETGDFENIDIDPQNPAAVNKSLCRKDADAFLEVLRRDISVRSKREEYI